MRDEFSRACPALQSHLVAMESIVENAPERTPWDSADYDDLVAELQLTASMKPYVAEFVSIADRFELGEERGRLSICIRPQSRTRVIHGPIAVRTTSVGRAAGQEV